VKNDVEYRSFSIETDVAENATTENFSVVGYATLFEPYLLHDFGTRKTYEHITRTAFDGVDFSDVIMLYNHEGRVLARCDNGTLEIRADERGLRVWADLSKSKYAREIYEDIAAGLIRQMSWGFTMAEVDHVASGDNTNIQTVKRIKKVYEVSAVSLPANNQTSIVAQRDSDKNRRNALKTAITTIIKKPLPIL